MSFLTALILDGVSVPVDERAPDLSEQALSVCARAMRADSRGVARTIGDRVLSSLPALASTESLRRAFDASLAGNLATALTLLETRAEPEAIPLSQSQLDFADLVVRDKGVELEDLLAAYRLGQSAFLACWAGHAASSVRDATELAQVVGRSSAVLDTYISRSAARVTEQLRGTARPVRDWAAERAQLALVLTSTAVDIPAIGSYALDGRHVGLVISHRGGVPDGETVLKRCSVALVDATQAQDTYGVVTAEGDLAIWVRGARNVGREPILAALGRSVPGGAHAALGRPAPGAAGFRSTHRQARQAAGPGTAVQGVVCWYDDVELGVLMSADPATAADYVSHHLGPLAAADDPSARLRQTLKIFLEEQGNARRAAERLFLHRNSVLYRIKNVQRVLGCDVLEKSLELRVALHLVDLTS